VATEKRLAKLLSPRILTLVWDTTMIHLDDLPDKNLSKFPDVFTFFRKSVELGRKEGVYNVRPVRSLDVNYRLPTYQLANWNEAATPAKQQQLTTEPRSSIQGMKGGETSANQRVKHYFFDTKGLENYKSTRNGLIGTEYSSKLSLWLAFGSISPRYLYEQVKLYEAKFGASEGTTCLLFELLWRDFFKFLAVKHGSMIFAVDGFNKADKPEWRTDKVLFEKWCRGETGYPFVDANMRELNATGFMSNRGRQNVASFLSKDLELDWRLGAEYFEAMLIDHDTCSNWGNWQYAAGVGADPRQGRYFNVIKQAYDYDPEGEYARLWVPELAKVPSELVYCPFRMSAMEQKRFGCVLGKEYPEPVVKMKFEWKPQSRNKTNKFASRQANSTRK
jgi:deoxyribodipyrimidine photo-lyase